MTTQSNVHVRVREPNTRHEYGYHDFDDLRKRGVEVATMDDVGGGGGADQAAIDASIATHAADGDAHHTPGRVTSLTYTPSNQRLTLNNSDGSQHATVLPEPGLSSAEVDAKIATHTSDDDAHHSTGGLSSADVDTKIATHTADSDAHHAPGQTLAQVNALIATHASDDDAHHSPGLTSAQVDAKIATHTADDDAHHTPTVNTDTTVSSVALGSNDALTLTMSDGTTVSVDLSSLSTSASGTATFGDKVDLVTSTSLASATWHELTLSETPGDDGILVLQVGEHSLNVLGVRFNDSALWPTFAAAPTALTVAGLHLYRLSDTESLYLAKGSAGDKLYVYNNSQSRTYNLDWYPFEVGVTAAVERTTTTLTTVTNVMRRIVYELDLGEAIDQHANYEFVLTGPGGAKQVSPQVSGATLLSDTYCPIQTTTPASNLTDMGRAVDLKIGRPNSQTSFSQFAHSDLYIWRHTSNNLFVLVPEITSGGSGITIALNKIVWTVAGVTSGGSADDTTAYNSAVLVGSSILLTRQNGEVTTLLLSFNDGNITLSGTYDGEGLVPSGSASVRNVVDAFNTHTHPSSSQQQFSLTRVTYTVESDEQSEPSVPTATADSLGLIGLQDPWALLGTNANPRWLATSDWIVNTEGLWSTAGWVVRPVNDFQTQYTASLDPANWHVPPYVDTDSFARWRQSDGTWGPPIPLDLESQVGWGPVLASGERRTNFFGTNSWIEFAGDGLDLDTVNELLLEFWLCGDNLSQTLTRATAVLRAGDIPVHPLPGSPGYTSMQVYYGRIHRRAGFTLIKSVGRPQQEESSRVQLDFDMGFYHTVGGDSRTVKRIWIFNPSTVNVPYHLYIRAR